MALRFVDSNRALLEDNMASILKLELLDYTMTEILK